MGCGNIALAAMVQGEVKQAVTGSIQAEVSSITASQDSVIAFVSCKVVALVADRMLTIAVILCHVCGSFEETIWVPAKTAGTPLSWNA